MIKINGIQIKYHLECALILKGHGIVRANLQQVITITNIQMYLVSCIQDKIKDNEKRQEKTFTGKLFMNIDNEDNVNKTRQQTQQ